MQDPKGISGYIYLCSAAFKTTALSKVETALLELKRHSMQKEEAIFLTHFTGGICYLTEIFLNITRI